MYRPDEKDIDRISREAAEHYHAPGVPAWDALQQVLDKELPQKEEKKRRGFFFFFFLLMGLFMAGTGIWYAIHLNRNKPASFSTSTGSGTNKHAAEKTHLKPVVPSITADAGLSAEKSSSINSLIAAPDVPAPQNNENNAPATADHAGIRKPDNKPIDNSGLPEEQSANSARSTSPAPVGTTMANIQTTARKSTINGVATIQNKRSATSPVQGKNRATISPAGRPFTIGRKQPFAKDAGPGKTAGSEAYTSAGIPLAVNTQPARNGKKIAAPPNHSTADAGTTTAPPAPNNNNTHDSTTPADSAYNGNDQPLEGLTDSTADNNRVANSIAPPAAGTKAVEKNDAAKTAGLKKAKSSNHKSINIGLVAGIDLSTVKYTHAGNAGYNIGLLAGYQFSRRWAVYTGIVYTKKNYELNGIDYHPPKHYWTQYVKLQTVEGWCRMWEVPLLARYTFNPGSKTAFFASTGVSSYFMKKQQYNYSYKNNMNQQLTAAWSTDSSFTHALSILHFSAGFEKKLGRHLNWQIEPYAKIPLGGVGFGNIRLSSFGVNFSVQYRQRLRR